MQVIKPLLVPGRKHLQSERKRKKPWPVRWLYY